MNSLFALCQRSAVISFIIFTMVACDKFDNPKSVSPQVEIPKNTQLESNRVELKRGVYSDLTLQPWQAQSEEQTQLLRDLFEGLTAYDAQGNLVPAVAESWQTKDNKTWIFTLRENAKWSNGESVIASDFVQYIQDYPQLCTYFYEFNLADPMLQKSAVRKAIASMISTKNLVADIAHLYPSNTFLPKPMLGEQESVWEPVVAEQLLSQNQISETHPLKLRIRYDDSFLNQTIATRLNRQLSQSDLLRVEHQGMGWQELQTARTKGDFQLIRSGWCADFNDPVAFLNLFYSKSPDNKNGYKNAEFDRLFESAMTTTSEKVRLENYAKLKGIVQQEHLVLPIFQYSTPVYLAPSIMGAQVNSVGVIYSKDLWRKVQSQ